MNQKDVVLVGLAPALGGTHSPVQVQKLFFLLDQNIPQVINGPVFNFLPYNYGPFDKTVYEVLEQLADEEFVQIIRENSLKCYRLTPKGQEIGEQLNKNLPKFASEFVKDISHFVRTLSFSQLVSAIYKAYPEMRANSVFQD